MRHPKQLLILALLAILALALAGCSDDEEANPADNYDTIDFNQSYGGLTTTDEAAAFGDPELLQEDALAGEAYDDGLADDPEVQELEQMGQQPGRPDDPARPRFTFVRILWGELDGVEIQDGDVVDWTGKLYVDRGIVRLRHVILFERPLDTIIRPRPDRQTISWTSHTGGHFDGLLIEIIEPPRDRASAEPNLLHFETGPLTQTFAIADLDSLDRIIPVEPAGNAVHFVGFTLGHLDPCPMGFLAGRWFDNPDSDVEGGGFRGRWVGLDGLPRGFMMGRYGLNDAGERVWFGKYINRRGQFRGLLAGTWLPGDEPGTGTFEGRWVNREETVEGIIDGRYLTATERPRGFFQGRWATVCDGDAAAETR